ncbi:MAG TPA: hypothetical protein P5248_09850, partial [Bacteroidales bacterium]|nr:hypothetical protein [Bacteroidales bacterium]
IELIDMIQQEMEENPLLEVIRADAMDYVGSCSTQFGLVVLDLFIGRMVPPQFETELFWSRLSRLVKRPGMVMFNKMVFDEQTRLQSAQLQEVARKSFEKVTVRRIRGPVENHVLIGEHLKD